ncbi:MAG: tetratricopeptide repeat protein, partial [Roseomonas sp.]|nr:tetratricopeptide repeat protein [Roseomonas sp.]
QRDLSVSHDHIATVLVAQGDLPGALRAYQAGMAIRTNLAERDPGNTEWQRDVFVSRILLGVTHLRLGQAAAARSHVEAALALARDRRARFPDQPQTAADLAAAESLLSRIEAATP